MAKITVILAVYNVEKYIIKCLESVKKQTFSDFECLIISDGSKDNSIALATEFIKDDKRFKVIEKENGGYGSVLERGIEEAEGEYILICDPDDYLADYALKHLYDCAISNNSDLVFGAKYDVFENPHEELYNPGYDVSKYSINGIKTYSNKDKEFSIFVSSECSPHSKLYKKSTIYKGPYPHKIAHTDLMLYCMTMNKIKTITYTDKPCSYYLLEREGNSMTSSKEKIVSANIFIMFELMKKIDDLGNNQVYICVLDHFRYCVSLLKQIENTNEHAESLKQLFNKLYCQKSLFVNHLKYAQGDIKCYISNKLLFNPITSSIYLNCYLKKYSK